MSINMVCISGNLTRDAEVRHPTPEFSLLRFSMAVNDRRRNKDTDEWEDVANFVDCTLFGTRGEAIAPYLVKGCKVAIEGRLSFGRWLAETGEWRSKLEVIVDEVEFLSPRRDEQPDGERRAQKPARKERATKKKEPEPYSEDDEYGEVYEGEYME